MRAALTLARLFYADLRCFQISKLMMHLFAILFRQGRHAKGTRVLQ